MFYGALGEQSIENLTIQMDNQKSDPNIPEELIELGASLL